MSWNVPSGRVLLIVIGKMPSSSSVKAMSIGFEYVSLVSMSIGAPIEI